MDHSSVDTEVKCHSVKGIVMRKYQVSDMNELLSTVYGACQPWLEGVDSIALGAAREFLEAEV